MQIRESATITTRSWRRGALRWLLTFFGFPLGGLAAELIVGPIDSLAAAVVGGAITGAILGAVQAWGLGSAVPARQWVAATVVGLTVGLGIGAATVSYGTSIGDLAMQGAICGLALGAAQAVVLRPQIGALALAWIPALSALWALGWAITTSIGVDVESQYTVFGSSGAFTVTVLSAALPALLATHRDATAS